MPLNRWKVLACTLTVGVGGLVVLAGPGADKPEPPKEPAALPPLTETQPAPKNAENMPRIELPKIPEPAKPTKADEIEFVIPVPPPVVKPADEPAKKPASEPVFEPIVPLPKPTEPIPPPPAPANEKPAKADELPLPALPTLPVPAEVTPVKGEADPIPPLPVKPEFADTPKAPAPPSGTPNPPPSAAPPTATTPLPPIDVERSTPPPPSGTNRVPTTDAPSTPIKMAKLKLLLRMGDGQARFEIRNAATSEVLLKVYGEKIEVQTPQDARSSLAGVSALGRVRFVAPGVEGTCDHLTILSGTGEVLLKGNIHLKAKFGKSSSEMTAEKMVYQIGTNGMSALGSGSVRPASYIPD